MSGILKTTGILRQFALAVGFALVPGLQLALPTFAADNAETPIGVLLDEIDLRPFLLDAPEQGTGPHIVLNSETVQLLKNDSVDEPHIAAYLETLKQRAEVILTEPLLEPRYVKAYQDEREILLQTARHLNKRVVELGLAWHLWDDERYADRARLEILNAAEFKDWNPIHFIDTAEMSTALAIGLDWLGAYLSEDDIAELQRAIIQKGLKPGLELYQNPFDLEQTSWFQEKQKLQTIVEEEIFADQVWPEFSFNWNMVSNTGMTLAALAIRDRDPDLSLEMLNYSLPSIRDGFAEYGLDGGFAEGPDYWSYATRYAAIFLSAIEGILNSDLGFDQYKGFSRAGDFILYMTGPTGLAFNFSDSGERQSRAALSWLAGHYDQPAYSWIDIIGEDGSRFGLDLIWQAQVHDDSRTFPDLPTGKRFDTLEAASFRTNWNDSNALFAAVKGGNNLGPHQHLDLGTFVIDADGERWAIDLGPGNYSLPGYFGDLRTTYYRVATRGHNTLTFDNENQEVTASAILSDFHHAPPDTSFAIIDLGSAYNTDSPDVRRGLALSDGVILLQDEIAATRPEALAWVMHTRADVAIDQANQSRASLQQAGKKLTAHILAPDGAVFQAESAYQAPPQMANDGVTRLEINLPASESTNRWIAVAFVPGSAPAKDLPAVIQLSDWRSEFIQDPATSSTDQ